MNHCVTPPQLADLSDTRAAAADYAARGWRVVPLHEVLPDGSCSCGKSHENRGTIGKHPRTARGLTDATTDPRQVGQLWGAHPSANVAIATGLASGVWVLGPDGEQGRVDLAALVALNGPLPRTLRAKSGSGGEHYYFRWPADGLPLTNRTNHRGTKIDARGEGGYAVAPPSRNANGSYEWADDCEPADAPAWLLEWVRGIDKRPVAVAPPTGRPEPRVGDAPRAGRPDARERARMWLASERFGERRAIDGQGGSNATMSTARGVVWGFDLGAEMGYDLLDAEFNLKCDPPWNDRDLRHKCEDADAGPGPDGKPRGHLLRAERVAPNWPTCPTPGGPPADPAPPPAAFVPFPVDALPEPAAGFVAAAAAAIGCDPTYVALPLLTAFAAAVGNSRRLEVKPGWLAPPVLWTAVVGESGTAKTPAFQLALKPARERQRRALAAGAEAERAYESRHAQWERDAATWKRGKGSGDPPVKPVPPAAVRLIASDATVEALAPMLCENPRGMLVACDELSGWFSGFDRYAGGGKSKGGGDAAKWLSMYNGEEVTVDRKTGVPKTIHVPRAAVCVTGGVQPGILKRCLSAEHRESGLAARLLVANPPRSVKRWTEDVIDPAAERGVQRVYDRLHELDMLTGYDGEPVPGVVRMDADAKAAFVAHFDAHAAQQRELTGDRAAAWSKLEETPARLAIVIHCVRWAAGDATLADPDTIDRASMDAAVRLTDWFKGEALRVYATLNAGEARQPVEDEPRRNQRRLLDWLARQGGSATAPDAQRGCSWLKHQGAAQMSLEALVVGGHVQCEDVATPGGGRASRVYRLASTIDDRRPDALETVAP